jgi:single-stranded-DNA-specific exonuclease
MKSSSRRWQLYPQQDEVAQQLGKRLALQPLLAQILLNRKIRSLDSAAQFVAPAEQPWNRLPDDMMAPGVDLIIETIEANGRILVYGDYDVDGMTSTSMMVQALRRLGVDIQFYLPHRFSDGYGLTTQIIPTLQQGKYSLLITLDCGITNVREIAAIRDATDIKVIVVDHHTIPETVPDADVIINPKYLLSDDSRYLLCTAGIVFHFLDALRDLGGLNINVDSFADLAALGTIADVVPLIGENRRLVATGMPSLSARYRLGIRKLLEVAGFERDFVSPRDVGFVIAPRLNAAGRLDSAMRGVNLLISEDEAAAQEMATILNRMNEDRQAIGQSMLTEAVAQVADEVATESVLVVRGRNWHAGVIGITASRLVEAYGRPVVIIADDGEVGRGSARTTGSVNIYDLLNACRDRFIKFGGHKEAAGFSILPDNIEAFKTELQQVAKAQVSEQDLLPILRIDAEVSPDQVSLELAEMLDQLAPFGQGNPTPVFYCNQLRPVEFKRVGSGDHLKVRFVDPSGKKVIDAIGFGLGQKIEVCHQNEIELAFTIEVNHWRGTRSPQLQLLDMR